MGNGGASVLPETKDSHFVVLMPGKKVTIQLAPGDRDRLEALIADGNTRQKHVRRARVVLLAGNGIGSNEIQRCLGVSKPTIRRRWSIACLS